MKIIEEIEKTRQKVSLNNEIYKQKLYEQYFTPLDITKYMSNLFSDGNNLKILDAGAGVGNLGAVTAIRYLEKKSTNNLELTLIEWDERLIPTIKSNMKIIKKQYDSFTYKVFNENFYFFGKNYLDKGLIFDRIILNPPYSIISKSTEEEIKILKELEIKTPNAYTNFLELGYKLLSDNGELVAIVPRSFCNGTRFTNFRLKMLENCNIEFIHSFVSRKEVFKEYGIFQEIVIIKLTKKKVDKVTICISDKLTKTRCEEFHKNEVIFINDRYKFIHIPDKVSDRQNLEKISKLTSSLKELGLNISTGKVVEYREPYLTNSKENDVAIMLYQRNLVNNTIDFNIKSKSKSYIFKNELTINKILEPGNYIIMKRMSYKENKKRVSSVVLKKEDFNNKNIAIENHLNYIHNNGKGLELQLALGLNAFLNSEILDIHIRRFNGHTQINASDIISLPMPSYETLYNVGKLILENKIEKDKIQELLYK